MFGLLMQVHIRVQRLDQSSSRHIKTLWQGTQVGDGRRKSADSCKKYALRDCCFSSAYLELGDGNANLDICIPRLSQKHNFKLGF